MKNLSILTIAMLATMGITLVGTALVEQATAAELVAVNIAADAKWFGHINVEKIRATQLFKHCKQECGKNQYAHECMEKMSNELGMNPMEDMRGVTLYATQYEDKVGVVLFDVKKYDREKMLAFFERKHPDYTTAEYGKRTLYNWTAKHHGQEMRLTGTFADDNLIVIGADDKHVKAALDVLDGKKAGLKKDAKLLNGVSDEALFVSQAIDVPQDYRKTTKCPVLRKCTQAFAQWTEEDGQFTANYIFTADSEETAKNFKAVVDGLKAIVDLRCDDMECVKKLTGTLQYNVQGKTFTLVWKASDDQIIAAMKQMMKHKKKHKVEK